MPSLLCRPTNKREDMICPQDQDSNFFWNVVWDGKIYRVSRPVAATWGPGMIGPHTGAPVAITRGIALIAHKSSGTR